MKPLFPTWPFTLAGLFLFLALAVDGIIRRDWTQGLTATGAIIPTIRLLWRGL